MVKDIHIGSIIRQKLEESALSISEFANRINRTRPTVYDIFTRKSIDTELLLKISEVLEYNFLKEVYLKEQDNAAARQEGRVRYIVGREVGADELKNYPASHYPIVLQVIDK